MATNDFQPFAYGGAANVVSQSAYLALTSILQNGFSSGVANSAQLNKVWRQSSIMAAVLAQFAADYSGNNSTDDGTTATLEANLVAAIRSATKTGVILADTGAANAYTAVNTPPLTSGTWVDSVVQQVKIAHANTGASTYAPDGLAAIPIYGLGLQPLQGGELALNGTAVLMRLTIPGVNSGNPIAVLMECAGGAQQVAPATQSQHAVQLGQLGNAGVVPGRLLRTSVYKLVSGVQNVSVNGGAFTTAGATTFSPLAATSICDSEVQGAGGGGSGTGATSSSTSSIGGGGGGGSYGRALLVIPASTAITVGAGGAGGVVGGNGAGGGTSSIGALLSVVGGAGSAVAVASSGAGVQGGTGSSAAPAGGNVLSLAGAPGGYGVQSSLNVGIAGAGGSSPVFGSSPAGPATINTGGSNAVNPGCGGSGGFSGSSNGTGNTGGNGAGGLIIIREYA